MDEIGLSLRTARESSGVSLEEASEDLKIKTLILENIEEGNIGCFKDIYVLKDYLYDYAKYLGLDSEQIMEDFNEYLFNYTSKIPIKEIEKEVNKKEREVSDNRIVSPYTMTPRKINSKWKKVLIILGICLIIMAIFWSIKQIAVSRGTTNVIVYAK